MTVERGPAFEGSPKNADERAILGGPLFLERQMAYHALLEFLTESVKPAPSIDFPLELPLRAMDENEWVLSYLLKNTGKVVVLVSWDQVQLLRDLTVHETREGTINITPRMDLKRIRELFGTLTKAHNRFIAQYNQVH